MNSTSFAQSVVRDAKEIKWLQKISWVRSVQNNMELNDPKLVANYKEMYALHLLVHFLKIVKFGPHIFTSLQRILMKFTMVLFH